MKKAIFLAVMATIVFFFAGCGNVQNSPIARLSANCFVHQSTVPSTGIMVWVFKPDGTGTYDDGRGTISNLNYNPPYVNRTIKKKVGG